MDEGWGEFTILVQVLLKVSMQNLYVRAFKCSPKTGLQRGASPAPEREAAHLGDARAGPRTLLYSLSPQATKGRSGKP